MKQYRTYPFRPENTKIIQFFKFNFSELKFFSKNSKNNYLFFSTNNLFEIRS